MAWGESLAGKKELPERRGGLDLIRMIFNRLSLLISPYR